MKTTHPKPSANAPSRSRPGPSSNARRLRLAACLLALLLASPALATDGASAGDGEEGSGGEGAAAASSVSGTPSTYYEQELGGTSTYGFVDAAAELPSSLHVSEGEAVLRYRRVAGRSSRWEVTATGFERRHETVDAVYDMILLLPLPEDAYGGDGFEPVDRAVVLREGSPDRAVALVYGGEKLQLKRNTALEKTFLPGLIGSPGEPGKLPSLSGTGYRYTAWDAIVTRDPHYADTVQGWARFRFDAAPSVARPDPADPRLAGWWITWIPSLTSDVEPYAVRMDVVPAAD